MTEPQVQGSTIVGGGTSAPTEPPDQSAGPARRGRVE